MHPARPSLNIQCNISHYSCWNFICFSTGWEVCVLCRLCSVTKLLSGGRVLLFHSASLRQTNLWAVWFSTFFKMQNLNHVILNLVCEGERAGERVKKCNQIQVITMRLFVILLSDNHLQVNDELEWQRNEMHFVIYTLLMVLTYSRLRPRPRVIILSLTLFIVLVPLSVRIA